MFPKIIFAFAMVCIVNASVLAVSDDDPEIEVASNTKSCELRACEKLCRRLKLPGGACVRGRCKCDNFRNEEDGDDFSQSDLEISLSQQGKIQNGCKVKACHWACRMLNKTSGSCVDGRCKCAGSALNAQEKPTDLEDLDALIADAVSENSTSNLEDSVAPRRCTHEACNVLCHKLKFREGVCIAGRCRCNNYFPIPKEDMNDLDESVSLDENFLTENILNTEDEVSEESLPVSELSEDPTKRGCDMRACHQLCRRLKLPGGVCVNGRCKCDLFFGTEEDAVDEYSELDTRRVCELSKCGRKCTRRGYEGATCVEGRCKCYNISKTFLPVSELSEDPTERGCNTQACDTLCRRLKFSGGACVNGHCKCNHIFGAEDAVDENSEVATRRVCKLRECSLTCTRLGYETSRCVNGWCKCRNKIKIEDTSPVNDVSSVENEESYNVLTTNEEEPTAPDSRACNTVNCNQTCHRLKYAGGWCRFGHCQCY